MSASLVGSEMCIRDSPAATGARSRQPDRAGCHFPVASSVCLRRAPDSACLLYTSDAADDM
eukprot:13142060-Alexandrium_andersonii.AAC.1